MRRNEISKLQVESPLHRWTYENPQQHGQMNMRQYIQYCSLFPAQLATAEPCSCGDKDFQDVNNTKAKPETHAAANSSKELLGAELWEIIRCHSHLNQTTDMYPSCIKKAYLTRKPNANYRSLVVPSAHIFVIEVSTQKHHQYLLSPENWF